MATFSLNSLLDCGNIFFAIQQKAILEFPACGFWQHGNVFFELLSKSDFYGLMRDCGDIFFAIQQKAVAILEFPACGFWQHGNVFY